MTNLYLLRHGKTQANLENRMQGQRLESPLIQEGIENALNLANKINELNLVIDKVITSDLLRAYQTAQIILEKLELKLELKTDQKLREIDFGDFTGSIGSRDLVFEYKKDTNRRFPNGESYNDLHLRITNFINYIKKEHGNKNILAVTHGGFLRGVSRNFEFEHNEEKLSSNEYILHVAFDDSEKTTIREI